ncbi:LuxR C-terminal-related transcriptional regulator [Halococcus sp. IIIV-5B]|uniref:LuxR C-terminal-related transcriptional regulator n=1 Tax=Halococcus sp. IIIV-5B TaxID=2321230 RepID=UPI0013142ECC|nr:LuxR C-terminal-related transcriptional regulator [Halococcus sp. IIIV-5B]
MVALSFGDDYELPDRCPYCNQKLGMNGSTATFRVGNGTSEFGEYSQIECVSCEKIVKRNYGEEDVAQQDDPLIDPDPWVYRAEVLRNESSLKRREAQVRSLKEEGLSHGDIAEKLGISESTVGEYSRRITRRINESARTIEEIGQVIDPVRLIEGQFDGWVIYLGSEVKCPVCRTDLSVGDEAVVMAERVSDQWETVEIFCNGCPREEYVAAPYGPEQPVTEIFKTGQGQTTFCLVEGELEARGPRLKENGFALEREESLTLSSPHVLEVWN